MKRSAPVLVLGYFIVLLVALLGQRSYANQTAIASVDPSTISANHQSCYLTKDMAKKLSLKNEAEFTDELVQLRQVYQRFCKESPQTDSCMSKKSIKNIIFQSLTSNFKRTSVGPNSQYGNLYLQKILASQCYISHYLFKDFDELAASNKDLDFSQVAQEYENRLLQINEIGRSGHLVNRNIVIGLKEYLQVQWFLRFGDPLSSWIHLANINRNSFPLIGLSVGGLTRVSQVVPSWKAYIQVSKLLTTLSSHTFLYSSSFLGFTIGEAYNQIEKLPALIPPGNMILVDEPPLDLNLSDPQNFSIGQIDMKDRLSLSSSISYALSAPLLFFGSWITLIASPFVYYSADEIGSSIVLKSQKNKIISLNKQLKKLKEKLAKKVATGAIQDLSFATTGSKIIGKSINHLNQLDYYFLRESRKVISFSAPLLNSLQKVIANKPKPQHFHDYLVKGLFRQESLQNSIPTEPKSITSEPQKIASQELQIFAFQKHSAEKPNTSDSESKDLYLEATGIAGIKNWACSSFKSKNSEVLNKYRIQLSEKAGDLINFKWMLHSFFTTFTAAQATHREGTRTFITWLTDQLIAKDTPELELELKSLFSTRLLHLRRQYKLLNSTRFAFDIDHLQSGLETLLSDWHDWNQQRIISGQITWRNLYQEMSCE